ncbi:MAG: SpoIIE family protein phosphatase [Desulfobacterales bacterium]|jgi:sigma-B regulation protein RsbU (phosphoserine phosphatase)
MNITALAQYQNDFFEIVLNKVHDLFFTIWYGVDAINTQKLAYASGGHPPAMLFSGPPSKPTQLDQLQTSNFIMGGQPDIDYQSKVQDISRSARLYVFSDGVYDITKPDGSIWGLSEFLAFSTQSFHIDRPNLVQHRNPCPQGKVSVRWRCNRNGSFVTLKASCPHN